MLRRSLGNAVNDEADRDDVQYGHGDADIRHLYRPCTNYTPILSGFYQQREHGVHHLRRPLLRRHFRLIGSWQAEVKLFG